MVVILYCADAIRHRKGASFRVRKLFCVSRSRFAATRDYNGELNALSDTVITALITTIGSILVAYITVAYGKSPSNDDKDKELEKKIEELEKELKEHDKNNP